MSHSADFLNTCCAILFEGNDLLGTDLGVVAQVEDGIYEVAAVIPPSGLLRPGDAYPLETTFIQEVCASRRIVVKSEHEGQPRLQGHPHYPSLGSEFLVGVPIVVGDKIWGTLSFSSRTIRTEPVEAGDLRILAAGAAEIASASALDMGLASPAEAEAEPARELPTEGVPSEEPLPEGVIRLPPPKTRPRTQAVTV